MTEQELPEAPAASDRPDADVDPDDLLNDQADAAEDFIEGLLDVLDLEGEAEADIEDDMVVVDVHGPEMAVLIGRHGATLEALQELTRAAVQHATQSRARLLVDIEGYRERHVAALEKRVRSLAARVRKERMPVELEPMNAYDRRVVHTAIAEMEGVMTESVGEDPDRRIVIRPA